MSVIKEEKIRTRSRNGRQANRKSFHVDTLRLKIPKKQLMYVTFCF